jgi:FixJ family two-component response regulator
VSANRNHVAVVDDDAGFLRAIGRLLRASGFEPVGYSSAKAFLEETTHAAPDCAVLDIRLAGMSGLDLRRLLTARGSTLPVIFVTAHDGRITVKKPGKLLLEAITKAVPLAQKPVGKR